MDSNHLSDTLSIHVDGPVLRPLEELDRHAGLSDQHYRRPGGSHAVRSETSLGFRRPESFMGVATPSTPSVRPALPRGDVQEVVEPPVGFGTPDSRQQLLELHVQIRSRLWWVALAPRSTNLPEFTVTDHFIDLLTVSLARNGDAVQCIYVLASIYVVYGHVREDCLKGAQHGMK
jgi:hypothetical protein